MIRISHLTEIERQVGAGTAGHIQIGLGLEGTLLFRQASPNLSESPTQVYNRLICKHQAQPTRQHA
jgi:hypothetical protein